MIRPDTVLWTGTSVIQLNKTNRPPGQLIRETMGIKPTPPSTKRPIPLVVCWTHPKPAISGFINSFPKAFLCSLFAWMWFPNSRQRHVTTMLLSTRRLRNAFLDNRNLLSRICCLTPAFRRAEELILRRTRGTTCLTWPDTRITFWHVIQGNRLSRREQPLAG